MWVCASRPNHPHKTTTAGTLHSVYGPKQFGTGKPCVHLSRQDTACFCLTPSRPSPARSRSWISSSMSTSDEGTFTMSTSPCASSWVSQQHDQEHEQSRKKLTPEQHDQDHEQFFVQNQQDQSRAVTFDVHAWHKNIIYKDPFFLRTKKTR